MNKRYVGIQDTRRRKTHIKQFYKEYILVPSISLQLIKFSILSKILQRNFTAGTVRKCIFE